MSKEENQNQKSDVALKEEEILKFWKENKIFEKSLEKESPNGNYVFYDGPPFATGLPHHGHILASTIKDVIPRYHTMNGKHVERRWGWDTHGLPIENIVEKNLNISGKKQIEEIGVEKFNKEAKSQVLEFVDGWKKTVDRMARWVDFDGAYLTMSNEYVESVWWSLKEVHKKNLLYEGEKVLPYCPRCETPIANSEIAMDNSYKDITDISVTVKFELEDEPSTYLLAWTTTPWTLPGNVAAAVNEEIEYVKVKVTSDDENHKDNFYILAKDLTEHTFTDLLKLDYEIVETIKAKDLIGKSYKPVFDYFKDLDIKNKENIWKVQSADYVTTEQGTGIVHLAPVYGEEDMMLAKEANLPLIFHVDSQGRFCEDVTDFKGMLIKEKDNHQAADIEIIKKLAHTDKLFAKEKIVHSYPHCFRCETPLFYNALSAWFINIQEIKQRALDLNNNINWVPDHLKEGRFKKSMEGAPDWNISRNRYWASPLPFWKSEDGKDLVVLGSLDELKEKTKNKNSDIYFVRHGQAEHNINRMINDNNDHPAHVTEEGKEEAKKAALELKDKKIDLIISSPLIRTKETSEIIAEELGLNKEDVIYDDRITEVQTGFNNKPVGEYHNHYSSILERFTKEPANETGETLVEMKNRVGKFLYEINEKYFDKNILLVGHEYVGWMLDSVVNGDDPEKSAAKKENKDEFVETGEVVDLNFSPIPHDENYELDFHRPYIDEITFEEDGKKFKRVPEVVDCWVESGSMPFAQKHYPFENEKEFEENFPAQFVAEYIAQTRTWFYYTHVLSTILFDSIPFENVVTTGNVMAEDGSKMSKSKKNFPDPWLVFDKYGVDAERYYLLSSPVVQSEDLHFSEKIVDEIYKKLILRLKNVVSFYEMYKKENNNSSSNKVTDLNLSNPLDSWIVSRLNALHLEVTENMEAYKLDRAIRPIMSFVDDLSTWYIRRSRDRFKEDSEDKNSALDTTYYVLYSLSKILAPFTPYLAEDVYQRIGSNKEKFESVHLDSWPGQKEVDQETLDKMQKVRDLVTSALEIRTTSGIKVRQPLQALILKDNSLENDKELLEILKDELNVKEVLFDSNLDEENPVKLDTELNDELIKEGNARELIRGIQNLRKQSKLSPEDEIRLEISDLALVKEILEVHKEEVSKTTKVTDFELTNLSEGDSVKIGSEEVYIKIS